MIFQYLFALQRNRGIASSVLNIVITLLRSLKRYQAECLIYEQKCCIRYITEELEGI